MVQVRCRALSRFVPFVVLTTVAVTLGPVAASGSDAPDQAPRPSSAEAHRSAATPQATAYSLIRGASARHEITRGQETVLLARAIYAPRTLPPAFRAPLGRDATLARIEFDERLPSLRGSLAATVDDLRATTKDAHWCSSSTQTLPNRWRTTHFVIWYGAIGGGLTIADYASVLEHVWKTEVGSFGWARPPSYTPNPAPGGKYPVRIANAGAGVYGYVSGGGAHAGLVGDNPATGWNEGDAKASCMVLNPGFANVGSANNLDDLKVTAAHEFLHSIQFGLGVISADANFIEGSAAWIEDEVYDSINDNYQYLWPRWNESMGAYPTANDAFYGYWLIWRALTERYGAGVPGGAEDVMQKIFVNISKGQEILPAAEKAFLALHTYLSYAFHQAAIASFFMKPCGGGYVLPLCFEEAAAYLAKVPANFPVEGVVTKTKGFDWRVRDDYAMNVVQLPDSPKHYPVYFSNASASSPMFWSVACDTGSDLRVDTLGVIEPKTWGNLGVDRTGCVGHSYAIVTNHRMSAPNPDTSFGADYKIWVPYSPITGTMSWSVAGSASGTDGAVTWSESWTENGSATLALKRDPVNVADYLVVNDGSTYSIDYTETRTEYDSGRDCTTTYDGSGSSSGTPADAGFMGSTAPNLDPPNPTDTWADSLNLAFMAPFTYTETFNGGCSSGSTSDPSAFGPFYHGLDGVSSPPCVPAALLGTDDTYWAGWPFVGAWNGSQSKFEFACTKTVPVAGGSQTITVSGTASYPSPP